MFDIKVADSQLKNYVFGRSSQGKELSVWSVLEVLRKYDISVWICGGSVRSWLENEIPSDIDLVVDAPIQFCLDALNRDLKAKNLLKKYRPGFGVVTLGDDSNQDLDISILRNPEQITTQNLRDSVFTPAASLAIDVLSRDFSINGLYYSPFEGKIVDLCNGIADLQNRTLRLMACEKMRQTSHVHCARTLKFLMKGYLPTSETVSYVRENIDSELLYSTDEVWKGWFLVQLVHKGMSVAEYCTLAAEYLQKKESVAKLQRIRKLIEMEMLGEK